MKTILSKIKKFAGISDINVSTVQIMNLTRDWFGGFGRFKCFVRYFFPRLQLA